MEQRERDRTEEERTIGEDANALSSSIEASGTMQADATEECVTPEPPRLRRGMIGWIWYLATPFAALTILGANLAGESAWAWAAGAGFCLMTARRMNGLFRDLEQSHAALQPTELALDRVGIQAYALDGPGRHARAVARLRLLYLLPSLREADASLLNEDQRGCLQRHLTPYRAATDPALTLAIVKALEALGDADALPDLERLAVMPAMTRSLRRVRNAARACLPIVEQRVANALSPRATPMEGAMTARAEAQRSAVVLTEEERAAAESVNARIQELEKERGHQQPGMRLGFLIATWLIIVPYLGYATLTCLLQGLLLPALLFGAGTGLATQLHRLTLTSRHAEFARQLAEIDDVQAVGQLAEALEWPDAGIRTVAMRALTKLLPRLHAGHASLLDLGQRASLYRMLKMENARAHAEFLVALLKALEQVGDTTAVPYVRELAGAQPYSSRQRRVRDAAEDCLPYLLERAEQNHHSLTLVRASSSSGAPSESLVRPVSGVSDTAPERLLRPAEPQESAEPDSLPTTLVSPEA